MIVSLEPNYALISLLYLIYIGNVVYQYVNERR